MTRRDKRTKKCPTCGEDFHPILSRFDIQKFCKVSCKRDNPEQKQLRSLYMRGVNTWTRGRKFPQRGGPNCHFWKGGVSEINRTERQNFESTLEYREFRRRVFARDNYTCQECGDTTRAGHKIKIQLDHIKPYRTHPGLRMEESNVRTICVDCHYKTPTYGAKALTYSG